VTTESGDQIEVEATLETMPSVLWDACVVPDGKRAAQILGNVGHAGEFLKDQYRHAKPILALGAACDLVENAQIPATLPNGKPDPGLLLRREPVMKKVIPELVAAIARHRHHERELDPPEV
jgi:catalase